MSLSRITPAALVLAGATLVAMPVLAQPGTGFPAKPVRIIVPFAPGGQSDIISRVVGQKLSEQWGQPMVYENRGGAGGTLGIDAMLRSPADGYAIGAGSQSALSIAQHLYAKLPYDPLKEVQGVVTLVLTPYAVAVNARVPVKNVADLVKLARSKSGLLNYGSSGAGSISHLAAELFASAEARDQRRLGPEYPHPVPNVEPAAVHQGGRAARKRRRWHVQRDAGVQRDVRPVVRRRIRVEGPGELHRIRPVWRRVRPVRAWLLLRAGLGQRAFRAVPGGVRLPRRHVRRGSNGDAVRGALLLPGGHVAGVEERWPVPRGLLLPGRPMTRTGET